MTRAFHRNLLPPRPVVYSENEYYEKRRYRKHLKLILTEELYEQIDSSKMIERLNSAEELSGTFGDLLLIEWSEQFPLFINEASLYINFIYIKQL